MKPFDKFDFKRIIIVAYRLPFKLIKKKDGFNVLQNSGGLVSAILSLSETMHSGGNRQSSIVWIGTGDPQLESAHISSNFRLLPVEIPPRVNENYYGGFCNGTIWPLFHYFPSRTIYEKKYFRDYVAANELFMKRLEKVIKPGDFIWIHDYQLFLLPQMVRLKFPHARIGFFLHIPFPSYELFRLLPRQWRNEILTGMTGADVVGFHTNDYTQHFIKSVKRTLGFGVDQNLILVNNRLCKADVLPLGIDYNKFHDSTSFQKVNKQKKKLYKILSDKKLIFSVDRLDYSKGLINRVKAFERFIEKYPEWHYKVIFNMVVVPSRDSIESYREIKTEIEATVGRINGKYGNLSWLPVIFQYKSLNFNEMIALYNVADVGLITPLRDGMNLVAKEYIACQTEKKGMLVLSEMAGAAVELNEAVLINPTDTEETADAINIALTMPEEERIQRIGKMQNRLRRYNVFTWTADFFRQVDALRKEQERLHVKYLDPDSLENITSAYHMAAKRLFLLDYDGTLTPITNTPQEAVLGKETREIIKEIVKDNRNTVVIISGRDRDFIGNQFKGLDVILIAEHGYFVKYPGDKWDNSKEIDLDWKERIMPVLNDYVDRCKGSMIEDKYASLAWHYRNADEEIAAVRIHELKNDLEEVLMGESRLQILDGNKVLEIKSYLYDKGSATSSIVKDGDYDFILAMGDDKTDEDLFRVVPGFGFTVKVGCKPTNARFNIVSQTQINEILGRFNGK